MDTRPASYPAGDMRVSDADRDRAVSELSEHFQAGRLTLDEFEERSGRALSAKTGRELRDLFADLPRRIAPAPAPAAMTGPMPARQSRAAVARMAAAFPIVLFIAIAAFGGRHGHHAAFGALVPVAIVCLVVLRAATHRRPGRI
jgi:uncharacterized protein DUF1707